MGETSVMWATDFICDRTKFVMWATDFICVFFYFTYVSVDFGVLNNLLLTTRNFKLDKINLCTGTMKRLLDKTTGFVLFSNLCSFVLFLSYWAIHRDSHVLTVKM